MSDSYFYYSNLVDKYKGPAVLWCMLRSVPQQASAGKALMSITEYAIKLEVTKDTIKTYLKDTRFFRSAIATKENNDIYSVYLVSGKKVLEQLEKEQQSEDSPALDKNGDYRLGVKFESVLTKVKDIVKESRLAITLYLQKRARKAKKYTLTKIQKKTKTRVINHYSFFNQDNTPANNTSGAMFNLLKKDDTRDNGFKTTIFLGSDSTYAGVTLETIAKVLGRSMSTITRSLKKVAKIRLYQFNPSYYKERKEQEFLKSEGQDNTFGKYYKFKNFTFKALPNCYYPCINILGSY